MNKIDEMTERAAKHLLNDICNTLGVGGAARDGDVILVNIRNAKRRSNCLSKI